MADNKASEATVTTENNLPDVVASLEMLTVASASCNSDSLGSTKMILRKRIRKAENMEVRNRRCSLKPKKRTCAEMESEEDVKKYYLSKSVKKTANNLETIFEEPDEEELTDDAPISMSTKRFKRMIQFQSEPSDVKRRKRQAKVARIFGSKFLPKRRQTSMQTLINKLNVIRAESLINIAEDSHPIAQVFNPYDAVRRSSLRQ